MSQDPKTEGSFGSKYVTCKSTFVTQSHYRRVVAHDLPLPRPNRSNRNATQRPLRASTVFRFSVASQLTAEALLGTLRTVIALEIND